MAICTEDDAREIFSSAENHIIEYDGKVVDDPVVLNKLFHDFDNWSIRKADGSPIGNRERNILQTKIKNAKIHEIEDSWSEKYESNWNYAVKQIQEQIICAPDGPIPSFNKQFLLEFFTMMDWRGFYSNLKFEEAYDEAFSILLGSFNESRNEQSKEQQIVYRDLKRQYLLKKYREFLSGDGLMYKVVQESMLYTSIHFLVAPLGVRFVTTDTPAFTHVFEGKGYAEMMPLTPQILMVKGKKGDDDDDYWVTHLTEADVEKYNMIIQEHATEFVVQ